MSSKGKDGQKEVRDTYSRRRQVAQLRMSRWSVAEIANQLQVDVSTVKRDIAALEDEWRKEAALDIAEHKMRELAELDMMERQVCTMIARNEVEGKAGGKRTNDYRGILVRLEIKKQRAKMLGLNEPDIIIDGGDDGDGDTGLNVQKAVADTVAEVLEEFGLTKPTENAA